MFHERRRETSAMSEEGDTKRQFFYGFGAVWVGFKIIVYFILNCRWHKLKDLSPTNVRIGARQSNEITSQPQILFLYSIYRSRHLFLTEALFRPPLLAFPRSSLKSPACRADRPFLSAAIPLYTSNGRYACTANNWSPLLLLHYNSKWSKARLHATSSRISSAILCTDPRWCPWRPCQSFPPAAKVINMSYYQGRCPRLLDNASQSSCLSSIPCSWRGIPHFYDKEKLYLYCCIANR